MNRFSQTHLLLGIFISTLIENGLHYLDHKHISIEYICVYCVQGSIPKGKEAVQCSADEVLI